MVSSITVTLRGRTASNKCRAFKGRQSRARGKAAFQNLRHTLELVDTKAFWRMEKVDIAEGAVYLIKKMVGGADQIPDRELIVFDEGNTSPRQEERERKKSQHHKKMKRVVEKRRRARETEAVEKLKEILMKYSNHVHAKMYKVDVLNAAASFLKSLALTNRAKTGSECQSPPGAETAKSPVSTPGTLPSPSSSHPGNSSLFFELSLAQNIVASLSHNYSLLQISNPLLYSSTVRRTQSKERSAVEKKREFYRPWE